MLITHTTICIHTCVISHPSIDCTPEKRGVCYVFSWKRRERRGETQNSDIEYMIRSQSYSVWRETAIASHISSHSQYIHFKIYSPFRAKSILVLKDSEKTITSFNRGEAAALIRLVLIDHSYHLKVRPFFVCKSTVPFLRFRYHIKTKTFLFIFTFGRLFTDSDNQMLLLLLYFICFYWTLLQIITRFIAG